MNRAPQIVKIKEKPIKELKSRKQRQLTGTPAKILTIIAIAMSIFQVYFNSFGLLAEMKKCTIHVAFLLVLIYFLYPIRASKNAKNPRWYEYILVFLGAVVPIYVFFRFNAEFARIGIANTFDLIMAAITVLLILEAARRTLGPAIPIVALVFILYALLGSYAPGIFHIKSVSIQRLLYRFYLTTEGIWASAVNTSATYLFLFVLFGAFLEVSGGTKAFNDIGFALGGRLRGGPAQVAVISSALMGSISGSPIANVMTTGAFTIPLMKKMGYKPEFAAGVEAAASTGGVIMPPVMGSVAFLMAGFIGKTYSSIIAAALMPAVLYYIGIAVSVDLEAQKYNLAGISKDELPRIRDVFKKQGIFLLPVVTIIITLVSGKSALLAGFIGIITTLIVSWFSKENRMGPKKIMIAMEKGARGALIVGIACACCSFIVTVATLTGIGSTLALNILDLSGGITFIALLLIALIVLFMSMGMPVTALYIVVAVVAVPALTDLGINIVSAHFFVIWMGIMSHVTPPVCMASYAASSLAGSSLTKTAFQGLKLAAAGLIIPFTFAFNPIMLMQNTTLPAYLWTFFTGIIGVCAMAISLHGYYKCKLPIFFRVTIFASAMVLIIPTLKTDIIGLVLLGFSYLLFNLYISKKKAVNNY